MKLIKATLVAIIPLALCLIVYWLSGEAWDRGPNLAATVAIGLLFSMVALVGSKLEGWLD